ncbi:16S rRNA (guanine(966)-N(2))-methyltransferase RsmD [Aliidiomarina sp. Khilg15.8]
MAKAQSKGQIRIIGGRWRGRKLPVLHAEGLRPTTDRIKETLFNWLQFDLHGARVVDLFAGSGGLGFEALSRGAAKATLVETQAQAVALLRDNITTLQITGQAEIDSRGALAWIDSAAPHSVDVLFLDPPFGNDWLSQILPRIDQADILVPGAFVYIESGQAESEPELPAHWQLRREKVAGQVRFRLFQRPSESSTG